MNHRWTEWDASTGAQTCLRCGVRKVLLREPASRGEERWVRVWTLPTGEVRVPGVYGNVPFPCTGSPK